MKKTYDRKVFKRKLLSDRRTVTVTIRLFMRNGQRKACWRLTWKLRHFLWLEDTWYEDSIYFKCRGSCKGNVAENIGRYVDGETLTAQGEEYEILTAFAALTRQ